MIRRFYHQCFNHFVYSTTSVNSQIYWASCQTAALMAESAIIHELALIVLFKVSPLSCLIPFFTWSIQEIVLGLICFT